MYGNIIDNLNRQKERIDEMIKNYQQPVNNYIIPKDFIEWRILNENEEVDNLYVQNKTLFINDSMMVLKGVDGSLEKWQVKKIYPVDKKDMKINELEDEIRKLKEVLNESTKPNESTKQCNESNDNVDGDAKSKSKTNGK